jgi:hypothetical protein
MIMARASHWKIIAKLLTRNLIFRGGAGRGE